MVVNMSVAYDGPLTTVYIWTSDPEGKGPFDLITDVLNGKHPFLMSTRDWLIRCILAKYVIRLKTGRDDGEILFRGRLSAKEIRRQIVEKMRDLITADMHKFVNVKWRPARLLRRLLALYPLMDKDSDYDVYRAFLLKVPLSALGRESIQDAVYTGIARFEINDAPPHTLGVDTTTYIRLLEPGRTRILPCPRKGPHVCRLFRLIDVLLGKLPAELRVWIMQNTFGVRLTVGQYLALARPMA